MSWNLPPGCTDWHVDEAMGGHEPPDEPEERDDDEPEEEAPMFGCACENPLSVDTVCAGCIAAMEFQQRVHDIALEIRTHIDCDDNRAFAVATAIAEMLDRKPTQPPTEDPRG